MKHIIRRFVLSIVVLVAVAWVIYESIIDIRSFFQRKDYEVFINNPYYIFVCAGGAVCLGFILQYAHKKIIARRNNKAK